MYLIVKYCFIVLCFTFCFASCNTNKRSEKPIATIEDKSLYLSDINGMFASTLSPEDSINLLNDYINKWARNQLIVKKAENNLSANEKEVSSELENYRASLLIYRYEQAYVAQRLDTTVTETELQQFYDDNKDIFQLANPLIKALYIKISTNAPFLKRIKEIYQSNAEKNISEVENLCFQGAVKYDYFNDEWVDFSALAKELPLDAKSYEEELIRKKYIETKDDQFTYLISVRNLLIKGGTAPFEHVRETIKSIVLNKRKQDLIKKLENDIYNEAVKRNEIKINL